MAGFTQLSTDPLRNFRFHVNIGKHNLLSLGFMAVTGLGAQTEVIRYREGGNNTTSRKMPGQTDFPPITLSRGVLLSGGYGGWNWFREIFAIQQGVQGGLGSAGNNFRMTFNIHVFRHPVSSGDSPGRLSYRVYDAWPSSVVFGDLNAGDNAVLMEQMTLEHEGFEVFFA